MPKIKLNLIKTEWGIMPVFDEDKEIISSLPLNEPNQFILSNPRNIGHHNKLFKLLNIAFDNLPEGYGYHNAHGNHIKIASVKMLLDQIKLHQGHVDFVLNPVTGIDELRVKSISFDSMSQFNFQEFYERSIDVILEHFLKNTAENEFLEVLDGDTLGTKLEVKRRTKFRVIIAGSRRFNNYDLLKDKVLKVLERRIKKHKIEVVCGMAKGADLFGKQLAEEMNWRVLKFPADWDDIEAEGAVVKYSNGRPYNAVAGHWRNQEMADVADCLLAFRVNNSKGTNDMIMRGGNLITRIFDFKI